MFLFPLKVNQKADFKKCFAYTFLPLSTAQSSTNRNSFLLILILLKSPLKVTVHIKGICLHFATAAYCTLHITSTVIKNHIPTIISQRLPSVQVFQSPLCFVPLHLRNVTEAYVCRYNIYVYP